MSIINRIRNVGSKEARFLQDHISNESLENLKENDSKLYDSINFAINMWNKERTSRVIEHNKELSKIIEWFVNEGEWVTLNQLLDSLPDEIIESIKKLQHENDNLVNNLIESLELIKKFNELSLEEKRKIMKEENNL